MGALGLPLICIVSLQFSFSTSRVWSLPALSMLGEKGISLQLHVEKTYGQWQGREQGNRDIWRKTKCN